MESWVFEPQRARQLRYEIDPRWYGELPRSHLYDRDHARRALSGALDARSLQAWIGARPLSVPVAAD